MSPRRAHVHVWIHVLTTDWRGRPTIACRCTCGRTLTAAQIAAWTEEGADA